MNRAATVREWWRSMTYNRFLTGAARKIHRLGATYVSPDGLKWERLPNTNAPLIAVYGQDQFLDSNWRGRILQSADAVTWKDVFQAEHHIEALAFGVAQAARLSFIPEGLQQLAGG